MYRSLEDTLFKYIHFSPFSYTTFLKLMELTYLSLTHFFIHIYWVSNTHPSPHLRHSLGIIQNFHPNFAWVPIVSLLNSWKIISYPCGCFLQYSENKLIWSEASQTHHREFSLFLLSLLDTRLLKVRGWILES